MKKLILSFGFLSLFVIAAHAQTSEIEKNHPLDARTSENPNYRDPNEVRRKKIMMKDPQYPRVGAASTDKANSTGTATGTTGPAKPPAADSAASPGTAEKKNPQK